MALTINQTKTEGITKLGLFPFANNIFAETRKKAVKEKKPERSWKSRPKPATARNELITITKRAIVHPVCNEKANRSSQYSSGSCSS